MGALPFSDWESGRWAFLSLAVCMVPFCGFALFAGDRFQTSPNVAASEEPTGPHSRLRSASSEDSSCNSDESNAKVINFSQGCRELFSNHGYMLLVLGMSASQFTIGGFAFWAPTYLQEDLGMQKKTLSMALGIMTMTTGLIGCGAGGALLDVLVACVERRRGPQQGQRAVVGSQLSFALGVCIVPFSSACPMMPDYTSFLILLGLCQICAFLGSAPIIIAMMESVPSDYRALAMGTATLVMHILGDVPSPAIVGSIAAHSSLQKGLMLLGVWTVWCPLCWGCAALIFSRKMGPIGELSLQPVESEELQSVSSSA